MNDISSRLNSPSTLVDLSFSVNCFFLERKPYGYRLDLHIYATNTSPYNVDIRYNDYSTQINVFLNETKILGQTSLSNDPIIYAGQSIEIAHIKHSAMGHTPYENINDQLIFKIGQSEVTTGFPISYQYYAKLMQPPTINLIDKENNSIQVEANYILNDLAQNNLGSNVFLDYTYTLDNGNMVAGETKTLQQINDTTSYSTIIEIVPHMKKIELTIWNYDLYGSYVFAQQNIEVSYNYFNNVKYYQNNKWNDGNSFVYYRENWYPCNFQKLS